jgi:DNA-binding MarR family transcriptional regulator
MSRETLERELISALRADSRSTEAFDELACEWLGINRTDARCLDVLEEFGSVSAGRLAQATGLTTGAITGAIDRLERLGYARRTTDPADRRKVLVESTQRARAAAWELYGPLAEQSAPLLARYSDDELRVVLDLIRSAMAIRDREAGRVRALIEERRRAAASRTATPPSR